MTEFSADTGRPEIVEDDHLLFLDGLRETGVTNMFGAAPYVAKEFDLSNDEARTILMYWMESFGKDDR